MNEEKNCQTCLYGITDKHYSHCDDSDIDEVGICMGWELSPVEKLKQENEKLRECVESLIEATVLGVNQWQEAWSPNDETNAQKVIKQARKTLEDLKHNQ